MTCKSLVVICGLLLTSCSSWETKKIPVETYFSQEWEALNLHQVDTYPSFAVCEDVMGEAAMKNCFEREMSAAFYKSLESATFVVSQPISDTVWVALVVNAKGKVCIDTMAIDEQLNTALPLLKKHIHQAALELPQLHPAIKKGIPVSSKYNLPIVLKVD
ncbi:MAG: hypothetical protein CL867_08655 [Cytophagaceae bacterium]|jgi:hypothetical protein|nr:hypothetical protein [Cytophagaceae bacterium]|tara:strand:+ start:73 stop:552 length:480 start_codon:yes stop_codon:yes gene_type:complete